MVETTPKQAKASKCTISKVSSLNKSKLAKSNAQKDKNRQTSLEIVNFKKKNGKTWLKRRLDGA